MPDSFTRHSPDSMLRPPSRFTDSSAPAETQTAASGWCGRRVVVAARALARSCFGSSRLFRQQGWCSLTVDPSGTGFPFTSLVSLSATSARNEQERGSEPVRLGNDGSRRRRFLILFVVPFRTAFPSFPIYLFVRPVAEWRERDAVLFHFGRFGLLYRSSFRLLSDTGFPFASLVSLSATSARNELKRGFVPIRFGSGSSHRGRFCLLFIASSCTVFPFFSPYTTPAITGGEPGREAVLFLFRKYGSRFRGSHCKSGKCAALAGFREGGRKGKPMPPLSLFSSYTSSGRKGRDEKRYIQFKSRPSDRRHAYF